MQTTTTTNVTQAASDASTALSSLLSEHSKTALIFQSGQHQQTYTHQTQVTSIIALSDLTPADAALYKSPSRSPDGSTTPEIFALTTDSTVFHPQGGGQPSDIGHFAIPGSDEKLFEVLSVRTSHTSPSIVLHFGRFLAPHSASTAPLTPCPVTQQVDANKRNLYSRLHTAGHALGAATRALLEHKIENFDELKASHFPDSASCEFRGLIDGKWKRDIQSAVDELVDKDAEVRIEWWTKGDFRVKGLERLLPTDEIWKEIGVWVDENGDAAEAGQDVDEGTRIRVVNIVGAEVYPCGGTHVPTTKACGKVSVRKISRQKGTSRVSYLVD